MYKLLLVLVLPLMMLLQAFLPPVTATAIDNNEQACSLVFTFNFATLPTSDVTGTTAVFHGTMVMTERIYHSSPSANEQQDDIFPLIFEYGAAPGVYPYRAAATIDMPPISEIYTYGENYDVYTASYNCSAPATGLSSCTTYYVRLKCTDNFIEDFARVTHQDIVCITVNLGPAMNFSTPGCLIGTGSHGAGGFNGTTIGQPTNLSNIVVQSAAINSTRVSPGQKADVTAYITNKGNSNGSSKVTLFVAGQQVESKGINLAGGESAQVHFSVSQNEPGTYPVYVNGVPAGNLTVDLFTNNDALIYGVIALFTIGIIGVLYLVIRRRST